MVSPQWSPSSAPHTLPGTGTLDSGQELGHVTSDWGHDRHYAETSSDGAMDSNNPLYHRWVNALEIVQPDAKGAVTRAKDKWNIIIRDRLRNETALRLTIGDRTQSVPIRVVDGLPDPFLRVIERFADAEWAILNEATLRNVASGTQYMSKMRPLVQRHWPKRAGAATPAEIRRVGETAQAWIELIEELRAADQIIGINEDVLGAYFYEIPEVRLYWVAIGIVARLIEVSIESLTVVVLAHELGHAYTHLGYDIDDHQWDSDLFARTNIHVIEGLAQFYTKATCEHLTERIPEAKSAFERLLEKQGPAYTSFRCWLPPKAEGNEERDSSGEVIRASMIECRRAGINSERRLREAIDRHRQEIQARYA